MRIKSFIQQNRNKLNNKKNKVRLIIIINKNMQNCKIVIKKLITQLNTNM